MWSTCHSLLCRYVLLAAAILGYFSLQVSAAAIGPHSLRSSQPEANAHEGHLAARQLASSDRLKEFFEAPVFNIRTGSTRRSGLFSSDEEEEPIISSSSLAAFLPKGADLTPGLPQDVTNGRSLLGTKQARRTRRQDAESTNIAGGDDTAGGVTRKYKFTVNYADIAPDGVLRNRAILVNNAFPGPTIEANYGDWIEVEVTNGLTDDGTTMHWHGLLHKESQWFDGTPSIQQCPIAPGQTMTYRFLADQVGSSWWHSHLSAQYTSGAFGAMIIHGQGENTDYDDDLGPVFLSDWYHHPLKDSLQTTMHSGNSQPPPADNLLINGKMNFPCETTQSQCVPNAGISKFYFSPGRRYRLRLINAGAAVNAKFSIDGHSFTVIAHDFTPVTPYQTDLISLANGQRADVIVEAVGEAGAAYWMRFDIGSGEVTNTCIGTLASTARSAVAAIYYEGADENSVPTSVSTIAPERLIPCSPEQTLDQLIPAEIIPANPQGELVTIEMNMNFTQYRNSPEPLNQWTINDISYKADLSRSLLNSVHDGTLGSGPNDYLSLYDVSTAGTVRVVVYDYFQFSHHPMHLHGHNFQILAEGYGTWDGQISNPANPMRRDVHVFNRALEQDGTVIPAYTVFQFFTDNPGIWPFHCHLAWHNSAGLFANFMVRQDDIKAFQIPDSIAQGCVDWNNFDAVANIEQIDSGI